ncbi:MULTISPECIES: helix-turn-helix domain-containing protein [unclassified Pseudonocardia]|uniref:PucR family transcriptional regulator n=1 Tax=unclassified Pseudonocardia TaxID=2619320 RepID=UPI000B20D93C|nr:MULTISPECIES: helix-turn-helix domain-containing protein [unclassified Pseudonocardia]MBN9102115.1 helix-turn-helix domain-containing protein [Pseudonocardia sp.]
MTGGLDRPWARVPAWVGAALRPELAGSADDIITAVRTDVTDYARPLVGRFGSRLTEGVSVALGQFLDLLGCDVPLEDVRVYRALGQLEHREGRTLAALQSAYQVGSRTLWRRLGESTTARQLPPDVIFRLAEALFTYIEELSAASVAGWAAEESSRAGSLQTRRHALVELLARPTPAPPAEMERLAAAAGWRPPARLAALVVEDAVEVATRLPSAIGADLDPVGVALVAVPERDGWVDQVRAGLRGRPGVLGPVVEPARAPRSIARAQAAWPLHVGGMLPTDTDDPLVRADEHLLALLLAAQPDLAADLCERARHPLADLPDGAAARAEETLRAWLDAHGDVTATAATLHVHPQTVRYRLAGLRETFGGALDDPLRRLELAIALRTTDPDQH